MQAVLEATGGRSVRQKDLPMDVMVYYVIGLGLFLPAAYGKVLRCLVAGLSWLDGTEPVRVAGQSAIAQARQRLGSLRWKRSMRAAAHSRRAAGPGPFAGYRLVSIDGSTLAVPDTPKSQAGLGCAGASRGKTANPTLRFAALVETETHLIFAAEMGWYATFEADLAYPMLARLDSSVLLLADRLYATYPLLTAVIATDVQFLVRVPDNAVLPVEARLADGSYRSRLYRSPKAGVMNAGAWRCA